MYVNKDELDHSVAVLGIWIRNRTRIRKICMFMGIPDPDPASNPDPAPDTSLFS